STHPPMEKRIEALQRLETQVPGTAAQGRGVPSRPPWGRRETESGRPPPPAPLFAMPPANITMDTALGLKRRQRAGVVFQPIGTADFKQIVAETEEPLPGTAGETGNKTKNDDATL